MTTAPAIPETPPAGRIIRGRPRLQFALLVGTLSWAGWEFPGDGHANLWFAFDVGGLRGSYVVIAAVLAATLPTVLRAGGGPVEPRLRAVGLRFWALGALAVVGVYVAWALHSGAPHPVADWINLPVLAAAAWAAARWLSGQPWRRFALLDLAVVYGAASLGQLLWWAAGGGTYLFDQRTPIFSGSHLQIACFAALVAAGAWLAGVRSGSRWYDGAVVGAFFSSSLLVLLSFRRSYWLLLVVGLVLLFSFQAVHRRTMPERVTQLAAAGALVAGLTMSVVGWQAIAERLESFQPTSGSAFATTNEDHINDIRDALDVIAESPVAGYGLGRFYETNRIWAWKAASFEVHNAPVHVWLKFGLFGMLVYLGFHVRWIVGMGRHARAGPAEAMVFGAAACFLLAELFVSLFGTWAYGSFHMTVHRAALLGAFLAVVPARSGRA